MFKINNHVRINTRTEGIYNNKTGRIISDPLENPSFLGWYVVEFDEPFYVENIKYTKDIFLPSELTKIN